jgi:hypothetical protein
MIPPEGFKRFPCGIGAAFGHVLATLPDAFLGVSLSRNVKQALIRCGILHDGGSLAVDRQNNRACGLFKPA